MANNINLNSEQGEINAVGALLASAETTQLVAQKGDIHLTAQTNDKYSKSSGWSIGVSFAGSKLVDAALKGGNLSDLVDAYAQSNAIAGALNTLANSDGNQTRQALINASLTTKNQGKSLLSAFGGKDSAATFNQQLNPFKSLSDGSKGGGDITVSFGRHKSSNEWQESERTQIYGGKNIIIRAEGKGTLNSLDGTRLSTHIDPLSEQIKGHYEEGSALHARWNQGDQYTDPDEQTINLTGAQNRE